MVPIFDDLKVRLGWGLLMFFLAFKSPLRVLSCALNTLTSFIGF